MKKLCLLLIIVTCCTSLTTTAQEETADWQVALHDVAGQQIVFITADGLSDQVIALPAGIYQYEINPFMPFEVSPDLRYLALPVMINEAGTTPSAEILIADLVAGTCCMSAQPPFAGVDAVTVGPFSPDGTQFAAAFGKVYTPEIQQALVTIDSATGAILTSVDTMALLQGNNAYFGDWTAEGIEIHPNCFACGGVWSGIFSLWNPESNALSPTQSYFSVFGYRLTGTGEFVEAIQHPDYPMPMQEGMLPPFNAIAYYREGYPPEGLPPVIFAGTPYSEANQITPDPHWVADGQAIYLAPQNEVPAHLVFRDGTSTIAENIIPDMWFLAGTPDGWLMVNRVDHSVLHFTVGSDGAISSEVVAQFEGEVITLQAPILGTTIEPGFAVIE